MLPSYIYYGVSSKEAVIVSKLGVPRFAVENVLNVLKTECSDLDVSISNYNEVREAIKRISSQKYNIENVDGEIIREIIQKRIGK